MPESAEADLQVQLLEDIAEFTHDPLGFVKYAFEWDEGPLEFSPGPRTWQAEEFEKLGKHLQNSETRHQVYRLAIASGNGIGKSAFVSMLTVWGLSTCEDCKITITASTGAQLQTKTQPELAKWFRLALNSHWFEVKAQSISTKNEKHKNEWRADLQTWDEKNPDAFAGLHNVRKRIIIIFDEASAIAPVIWLRANKCLTDEDTELIFVALGNPTVNSGTFPECFGVDKHRWNTRQIDARTVEGTNKEELQKDVDRYGEDSDYIRYSVRGEFPRGGSAQFIPGDLVAACRRYRAQGFEALPKILACDVARFGDDQTVIGLRQGRKFEILGTYRGLDTNKTTDQMVEAIRKHAPDAIVVDGDGIGGAVVDQLKGLGFKAPGYLVHEFHGGASPFDPNMYFNKRTEVWGWMKDWLAAGAQIPDLPELERQLTGPMFDIVRGKVQHGSIFLEHKDDMKKRGLESPDLADCLAYTFAVKIAPKPKPGPPSRPITAWS
jgi:hypothetical protein